MFRWFEEHQKISLAIAIIGAIGIFYLSSLQFPQTEPSDKLNLKAPLYHLTAFFLFSLFLYISFVSGKHYKAFLPVFLFAVAYGILDEIHQIFVPSRGATIGDMLLDTIGIFLAFSLYFVVLKTRKNAKYYK